MCSKVAKIVKNRLISFYEFDCDTSPLEPINGKLWTNLKEENIQLFWYQWNSNCFIINNKKISKWQSETKTNPKKTSNILNIHYITQMMVGKQRVKTGSFVLFRS